MKGTNYSASPFPLLFETTPLSKEVPSGSELKEDERDSAPEKEVLDQQKIKFDPYPDASTVAQASAPAFFVPIPSTQPVTSLSHEQLQQAAVLAEQQQQEQQILFQSALTAVLPAQSTLHMRHNFIPLHLQASAIAASFHGTPGHSPALIPPSLSSQQPLPPLVTDNRFLTPPQAALTVQDRPMTPPVYNGVNPSYPGLRVLNSSPPIFVVDNFLTSYECDFLIHSAQDCFSPAPVVGAGAGVVLPSRTSSTCYLAREDLPDILRKVSLLTGKPPEHCELPQVGRYFPTQQYLQHYDAFDLATEDGRRFAANGGQRTITVLIYLNDVLRGGSTRFPALNLEVQPRRGMALVFFPATVDGMLDKMALHAAMPAVDTKYVSQIWIRQSTYTGQPSKRLPQTLGVPFHHEQVGPPAGATTHQHENHYFMEQPRQATAAVTSGSFFRY